jgi:very-short-patch-repair endonuclease
MSKICDEVHDCLKQIYPLIKIKKEEFVTFRNQKLFLDLWVPQLNLVIEVHGRQHDEFVEYFHGDAETFKASKRRDSLKEEWAGANGYTMVVIRESDFPITPDKLLKRIDDAGNIR